MFTWVPRGLQNQNHQKKLIIPISNKRYPLYFLSHSHLWWYLHYPQFTHQGHPKFLPHPPVPKITQTLALRLHKIERSAYYQLKYEAERTMSKSKVETLELFPNISFLLNSQIQSVTQEFLLNLLQTCVLNWSPYFISNDNALKPIFFISCLEYCNRCPTLLHASSLLCSHPFPILQPHLFFYNIPT